MKYTRRDFVKASAMCAAFAGIAATSNAFGQGLRRIQPYDPDAGKGRLKPIENRYDAAANFFQKSTFEPCLNTTFKIQLSRQKILSLTLIEVADRNPQSSAGLTQNPSNVANITDNFALLFRGTSASPLTQNTYTFRHDALGTFRLFIVPVGISQNSATEIHYEAVINRLKS